MSLKAPAYLIIIISFCCFSCATIIHGSKQKVAIVSEPRNANITIDGFNSGNTPYLAVLSRKKSHTIKIEMAGFQPFETTIKRKLDGWFFGNLLIGGIIGFAVDAATGGMYRLTPADVTTQLAATTNGAAYNTKDGIYFSVVLQPNPNWEKVGQLQQSISGK